MKQLRFMSWVLFGFSMLALFEGDFEAGTSLMGLSYITWLVKVMIAELKQ